MSEEHEEEAMQLYRIKNFRICSLFPFWSVILMVLGGVIIAPTTAQYFDPNPIELSPPYSLEHHYGRSECGIPDLNGDVAGSVMVTCHNGEEHSNGSPEPGEVTRIYFYDVASWAVLRSIIGQNNGLCHCLIGDVNGDVVVDVLVAVFGETQVAG